MAHEDCICLGKSDGESNFEAKRCHNALTLYYQKYLNRYYKNQPQIKQLTHFQVFINWLDLKEGWDSYQGDSTILYQVMVIICEATGMVIIYFTQSAKEDENFLLM